MRRMVRLRMRRGEGMIRREGWQRLRRCQRMDSDGESLLVPRQRQTHQKNHGQIPYRSCLHRLPPPPRNAHKISQGRCCWNCMRYGLQTSFDSPEIPRRTLWNMGLNHRMLCRGRKYGGKRKSLIFSLYVLSLTPQPHNLTVSPCRPHSGDSSSTPPSSKPTPPRK